jgi:hypothetical protein
VLVLETTRASTEAPNEGGRSPGTTLSLAPAGRIVLTPALNLLYPGVVRRKPLASKYFDRSLIGVAQEVAQPHESARQEAGDLHLAYP